MFIEWWYEIMIKNTKDLDMCYKLDKADFIVMKESLSPVNFLNIEGSKNGNY